ncbi:MAG: hypothetical protein AB9882_06175 [Ignavibacteriaceae bacterium]
MNTENLNKQPEPVLKALANLEKIEPVEELEEKIYNRLDPRLLLDWFSFSKAGTVGIAVLIVISLVMLVSESSRQVTLINSYSDGLKTVKTPEKIVRPASLNFRENKSTILSRPERDDLDSINTKLTIPE